VGLFVPTGQENENIAEVKKQERKEKLEEMKQEVSELSELLLIYSLHDFFLKGTEAAKNAVKEFEHSDVAGFNIGNILYEGENENVMMGVKLAENMMECIGDERVSSIIKNAHSMHQIVNKYKELRDEK